MKDIIDINEIKKILKDFAIKRDWVKFHNPKNIAISIGCETGELLEIFQWLSDSESEKIYKDKRIKEKIMQEIADILLYIIRLSDLMDINLNKAIRKKLLINNKKYPADIVKGSVKEYNRNHLD